MSDNTKYILFGAGDIGKKALRCIGPERVDFFVDNSTAKIGTIVEGIPVISFDELKKIHMGFQDCRARFIS